MIHKYVSREHVVNNIRDFFILCLVATHFTHLCTYTNINRIALMWEIAASAPARLWHAFYAYQCNRWPNYSKWQRQMRAHLGNRVPTRMCGVCIWVSWRKKNLISDVSSTNTRTHNILQRDDHTSSRIRVVLCTKTTGIASIYRQSAENPLHSSTSQPVMRTRLIEWLWATHKS